MNFIKRLLNKWSVRGAKPVEDMDNPSMPFGDMTVHGEWFCANCHEEWEPWQMYTGRCKFCGNPKTNMICITGYWIYKPDGTKDYFQECD